MPSALHSYGTAGALDMTLDEIRVLLRFKDAPKDTCGEVDQLLEAHITHVVTRIKELKVLERELRSSAREMLGRRSNAAELAGSLKGLETAALEHDHSAHPSTDRRPHVFGSHSVHRQ
jgi:DNA-binding transcriptional MerR regulator